MSRFNTCDYNINATDSGECSYAQDGYDCNGNIDPQVGDLAFGGIVFYVDSTEQRGLVAAIEDLPGNYEWGCLFINIDGSSFTSGYVNTQDIINTPCSTLNGGITAAQAASNANSNGYNDWFLPSIVELQTIYDSIALGASSIYLNNFSDSSYWSSTQLNSLSSFSFISGTPSVDSKSGLFKVRPIRACGYTLGCIDSLACNYNPDANMADGSCEYPEHGYDCNGNITAEIGDVMEGGYLFYGILQIQEA